MEFIDLRTQYRRYQTEIDLRMRTVLDHGAFIMGREIVELETLLANYTCTRHCITVASGTDSLEIALRALEIGPGDEVITVPFTWISTAEVIALVGARTVFVDIEPGTYNMDPSKLEAAITPRTKAIMPVSLFGQMADYDRINRIAAQHSLPVIEDAAQSFGAQQNGRRSCGVTRVASTSFFPAKPLGCYGDGGALFTNDDALAERMRAIRVHGGLTRHQHTVIGMNGRFDTLQAAVLLAKWPHFESEIQERARLGHRYSELLGDNCTPPAIMPGNTHVYAQYTIRVPRRDDVAARLKARGVPTGVYYPKCIHEQPAFQSLGYTAGDFPMSEQASREVLSLPMHPFLSQKDQDFVIEGVKETVCKVTEREVVSA
jgi:UDP-2-acetamido-2-deoxy-ribo-hexuluronate aminotransferase